MLSNSSLEWTGRAQVKLPGRLEWQVKLKKVSSMKPAARPDGLILRPPSVTFMEKRGNRRNTVLPYNVKKQKWVIKTFYKLHFILVLWVQTWKYWSMIADMVRLLNQTQLKRNKFTGRGSLWMRRAKWIAIKNVVNNFSFVITITTSLAWMNDIKIVIWWAYPPLLERKGKGRRHWPITLSSTTRDSGRCHQIH